jgi:hypothetical protein
MTWSENSDSSKNNDFPPIQKNIKFSLLIDLDIEIKLNGLDQSFLI